MTIFRAKIIEKSSRTSRLFMKFSIEQPKLIDIFDLKMPKLNSAKPTTWQLRDLNSWLLKLEQMLQLFSKVVIVTTFGSKIFTFGVSMKSNLKCCALLLLMSCNKPTKNQEANLMDHPVPEIALDRISCDHHLNKNDNATLGISFKYQTIGEVKTTVSELMTSKYTNDHISAVLIDEIEKVTLNLNSFQIGSAETIIVVPQNGEGMGTVVFGNGNKYEIECRKR